MATEFLIQKPPTEAGGRNHGTTKCCSSSASAAAVGMVIGGRAARACDVCGKERARWFCAADEAYLCERCDGTVHSANAVAKRHERVRLRPNGMPAAAALKPSNSNSNSNPNPNPNNNNNNNNIYSASRKRPRSIRRHNTNPTQLTHRLKLQLKPNYTTNSPAAGNNYNSGTVFNPAKVKTEPCSGVINSGSSAAGDHVVTVPEFQSSASFLDSLLTDCDEFQHDDVNFDLHEVPIYMPLDNYPELHHIDSDTKISQNHNNPSQFVINHNSPVAAPAPSSVITTDSGSSSAFAQQQSSSGSAAEESLEFFVPGNHIDIENFLDADDDNLCDIDVEGFNEMYSEMGSAPAAGNGTINDGSVEDYGDNHGDLCFDDSDSSPRSWLCRDGKVKVELQEVSDELNSCDIGDGDHKMQLFDDINMMIDLGQDQINHPASSDNHSLQYHHQSQGLISKLVHDNLGLTLDLDDVVNAWADKGAFWVDGQRPDESTLHTLEGWLINSNCGLFNVMNMNGDHQNAAAMFNHNNNNNNNNNHDVMSNRSSMVIKGGAREARVMRYREKRRTRLFSKKIRYEVRKLNAEKRPRMKGRFVKRTPTTNNTQQ